MSTRTGLLTAGAAVTWLVLGLSGRTIIEADGGATLSEVRQQATGPAGRPALAQGSHAAVERAAETRKRSRDAYLRGGIRAAAEAVGDAVIALPFPRQRGFVSLEAMVAATRLLVVGTAVSNVCRATDDGTMIHLHYSVRVDRVLKGRRALEGETITVMVPGGMVRFEDGTSTTIQTPNFRRPQHGEPLLWCLAREPGRGPREARERYTVSGGPLGLFVLEGRHGFVHTSGGFDSPFAERIIVERLTRSAFIARVEAAVARAR